MVQVEYPDEWLSTCFLPRVILERSITYVPVTESSLWLVVQSLSCVQLFVTLWTAARQASLSFTISRSLLRLMFIELVMPSNHLILFRPFLLLPEIFPSIRVFSSELTLCIRGQIIGASASVLPMNNIQD